MTGEDSYVEVVGHASVVAPTDLVQAQLATEAWAITVAEALSDANEAAAAMASSLREHGVAPEDLGTSGVDVSQQSERPNRARRIRASVGIQVVLRDFSAAGEALSAAMAAAGDLGRIHGVAMGSSASADLAAEARGAAWRDAEARASEYAELAGRSLGRVLEVEEMAYQGMPRRVASRWTAGGAVPAAALGLEPGSQSVEAAVRVRWRLD